MCYTLACSQYKHYGESLNETRQQPCRICLMRYGTAPRKIKYKENATRRAVSCSFARRSNAATMGLDKGDVRTYATGTAAVCGSTDKASVNQWLLMTSLPGRSQNRALARKPNGHPRRRCRRRRRRCPCRPHTNSDSAIVYSTHVIRFTTPSVIDMSPYRSLYCVYNTPLMCRASRTYFARSRKRNRLKFCNRLINNSRCVVSPASVIFFPALTEATPCAGFAAQQMTLKCATSFGQRRKSLPFGF
jgi:hypothetical protein